MEQALIDILADELVENGELVSYSSIQKALKVRHGRGASDRDICRPLTTWKKKRRYRAHLAEIDLPEEMEKPLAQFIAAANKIASARAQLARRLPSP